MLIYILTGLIVFLSLIQSKQWSKDACLVFWVPLVFLCVFERFIPAPAIYLICSMFAAISAVIWLKLKSELSLVLAKALFISMGINLTGVGIWCFDLNQDAYYIPFVIFYFWVAYLILKKGDINWVKLFSAYRLRLVSLRSLIMSSLG